MTKGAFEEIDTPALLLDVTQVEQNIDRYQRLATSAKVSLRPHSKAHKCAQVGRLQTQRGAVGLCCAKLGEAEAMVVEGLDELLVTTPVVGAIKIRRLVGLAHKAKLTIVVDDAANIAELASAVKASGVTLDVLIDVDVGQGRTGVPPGSKAAELAALIVRSQGLRFLGLQGYQGKLQAVADFAERTGLVKDAMTKLGESARLIREAGMECRIMSGGGTGSFPIDLKLCALNELQPGSYITMDTTYAKVQLGEDEDRHPLGHPLTILASVISRPTADRAVVDVGWKTASSDSGTPSIADDQSLAYEFAGDEHGIVRSTGGPLSLMLGDRVELIPSHCDTTVNLYDRFVVHRDGRLESSWSIEARGRSQ